MKNKGWSKGFTLIELLIVIVIVGIIAAIAIPAFTGGSQTTGEVLYSPEPVAVAPPACQDGMKMLVTGAQMLDAQGHGIPCN